MFIFLSFKIKAEHFATKVLGCIRIIFKKHPDVDFGEATFFGTSFPEPLQYGDIIISNSRMDEAILELKIK